MKIAHLSCAVPMDGFDYPYGLSADSFRNYSGGKIEKMERFFDGASFVHIKPETYSDSEELSKDLLEFDFVIIGGSPYSVNSNESWIDLTKRALIDLVTKSDYPTLFGICFGCQLLCDTLGGSVSSAKEYNKGDAPVIDAMSGRVLFWGFRAHEERISKLPPAAKIMAKSENEDYPYLIKFSDDIWGTQIHPENQLEEAMDFDKSRTEEFWRQFFAKGGL